MANAAIIMDNGEQEDAVIVAVTRDGQSSGRRPDHPGRSGPRLLRSGNKTDKEVFLRADIRANYRQVMDAVDGSGRRAVSELG